VLQHVEHGLQDRLVLFLDDCLALLLAERGVEVHLLDLGLEARDAFR
jgi:hypothetical protein